MSKDKDLEIWESIIEDIKSYLKDEKEKIQNKKDKYKGTIKNLEVYSKKYPHLKEKIEQRIKELNYGGSLSDSINIELVVRNQELLTKLHENLSNQIEHAQKAFYYIKHEAEGLNYKELNELYNLEDIRISYLKNSNKASEDFIMLTVLNERYYNVLKATILNFEKYDMGEIIVKKNDELKGAYRIILPEYIFDTIFKEVINGYMLKEPLASFISKELDHARNPMDGLQEHYLNVILAPHNKDLIIRDLSSSDSKLYQVILSDIDRAENKQIKMRKEILDSLKDLVNQANGINNNNPIIFDQEKSSLEKMADTLHRLSFGYWENVKNSTSWNDRSKNIVESTTKIQSWVRRHQTEDKVIKDHLDSNLVKKITERRNVRTELNR